MRAGLLLLVLGCSSPTNRPQFDQIPRTNLKLEITAEPPPDSAGRIFRDAVLRVTLDDYPDPDTVQFGPLLLRSGNASFDVLMRVDLVGKSILMRPRSLLLPETQYELVVGADLRSLSGRVVGTTVAAPLSVGSDVNPSPTPTPAPIAYDTEVQPDLSVRSLLGSCAPYCHTPDRCPGRPGKRNPSVNLDLSLEDPATPRLGMINVPSTLLSGTPQQIMRVQPGEAAQSMLMRKLLGGDPHAETSDPPTANLAVPGRRMPLYESPCGAELPPPDEVYFTTEQLRLVQDWIDQGARTR